MFILFLVKLNGEEGRFSEGVLGREGGNMVRPQRAIGFDKRPKKSLLL